MNPKIPVRLLERSWVPPPTREALNPTGVSEIRGTFLGSFKRESYNWGSILGFPYCRKPFFAPERTLQERKVLDWTKT